jgi:hypothetical protein
MMGITLVSLIAKLHKWDESAMYFDGGCLGACSLCHESHAYLWGSAVTVFSIAMYTSVAISALRTMVDPVPDVDTHADQVEALQLLSAGNVVIIVLLVGVLVLQAGQEWARRADEAAGREEAAKVATETEAKESKKEK